MGPIAASPVVSSEARRRIPFPLERRLVLDTLRLGHRQPMMHGLLEVDVTRARTLLRELRQRTGEGLSFTAFVLACLGRAVADHPEVHALRDWFGRSVLFEDVDVTTMIEVDVEGRPFALAHVVRAVNRRSPREIHDEIRSIQHGGPQRMTPRTRAAFELVLHLPGVLRRAVLRCLLRFPRFAKRDVGAA